MSWIIYAILSAFFAGLVAIFGKIGIAGIDNTLATTVRSFVMFIFLFGISAFLGVFKNIKQIDGKNLTFIILSGVAGALSWLCYFYALKTGNASAVAAIDRLSVVFVVILAGLFLAEKITLQVTIGVILLTIGAILLAVPNLIK
jgi:transporter family protein